MQAQHGSRDRQGASVRENLATRIVRGLEGEILRGALKPGDRLPSEHQLEIRFGVSRAVVREAITSLKAEGLVATRQGAGAFVLQLQRAPTFRVAQADLATLEELIQMLELRATVEAQAAALAAERRSRGELAGLRSALDRMRRDVGQGEDAVAPDFQFHLRIARATGNRHFADFIDYLGTMLIPRTRVNLVGRDPARRRGYLDGVNHEHERIYRAIADRDPDGARAAMQAHLTRSRDRLHAAATRQGRTTPRGGAPPP
ncbi:MAG: FadR family transcriptional regulator [Burkholderiaceae bacterium]|nr:FadR family transcriptional regulator [Burkholderiaceae bacterium]